MPKSAKFVYTLTQERQQIFEAIELRRPHLKGSYGTIIDHALLLFLEGSPSLEAPIVYRPAEAVVEPMPTSEETMDKEPFNPNEDW